MTTFYGGELAGHSVTGYYRRCNITDINEKARGPVRRWHGCLSFIYLPLVGIIAYLFGEPHLGVPRRTREAMWPSTAAVKGPQSLHIPC